MKILVAIISLQLWALSEAQTQSCPDSVINTCVWQIVGPISGSVSLANLSAACSRLNNLTFCLPREGGKDWCKADTPMTGWIRDAIYGGLKDLCAANQDRIVSAASCWNKPDTRSKINSCNSTFVSSLMSGASYCPTAGTYLTCVQAAVLADCGPEVMFYFSKFTYSVLVGFATAKGCSIWNNNCFPWNITACVNSTNTLLGAVGQGKSTLRSSLDSLCSRIDVVSSCLKSQNCPSDNTFYQLISNQLKKQSDAICVQKEQTSYYDGYADCWLNSQNDISNCNRTFMASISTPPTFCSSSNTFLQCTQNVVNNKCGASSATALTGYFYYLLSVNATVNNCVLDSKYDPATGSGGSTAAPQSNPAQSSSTSTSVSSSTTAAGPDILSTIRDASFASASSTTSATQSSSTKSKASIVTTDAVLMLSGLITSGLMLSGY